MTKRGTHASCRRASGAFTLLELLVSSAILLALLVLLLGACEGGSRFWNQAERRRAPLREAGAALRFIARDLRSAVITSDPSSLRIGREENGDSSLFFLVSHSRDHRPEATVGDLCATGYFLARSPDRGEEQDLYRFHASGQRVLEAVRSGKLAELYATASPGATNTELMARHVASLSVRPIAGGTRSERPDTLALGIITVDPTTEGMLARQASDQASRRKLLSRHGARLGAIVALPAKRDDTSSR